MLFFSLDVILQALFHTYGMRGGSFWDEKIRTNEELVNEANRPTSGCANGSTSDHLVGQVHIYIENHRGLLVFSDKEVRLLLKAWSVIN